MNIHNYEKQLSAISSKLALGYESDLDFSYGYLTALVKNECITRKEFNILFKVFCKNEDGEFFIDQNGLLCKDE